MVAVDIPRKRIVEFTVYESLAEAEWFMHQFNHALGEFVKINTGVTLAEPR